MALYTVQKVVAPRRGSDVERYEVAQDGRYVLGIDIPARTDMDWYRTAARRVRANLFNRAGDESPTFGAPAHDAAALTFAGMLNDA